MASEADSGPNTPGSSAKSARRGSSSKTLRSFDVRDSTEFFATSWRSGTMRNGIVSPLPPLVRLTKGTASGLWPTPSARDYKDTPGMARSSINSDGSLRKRTDQLARRVYAVENTPKGGGTLNPQWVEWLMGFPLGHTESDASATQSSPTSLT